MALALLLLQIANTALAASTLWIRFRAPFLWDDQAIVYSTCAGFLAACFTALLVGISLLLDEKPKTLPTLLNLVLTLGYTGLQGWFLFATARETGILGLLKSRLGGG